MTTEQILEQVRRKPRTLIYFGDNIAQFSEVAETEIREKRMERYWKNREEEIADSKYYRQKKKLMEG